MKRLHGRALAFAIKLLLLRKAKPIMAADRHCRSAKTAARFEKKKWRFALIANPNIEPA